jgi:thiol-disulfide isomerase/thioredoxin
MICKIQVWKLSDNYLTLLTGITKDSFAIAIADKNQNENLDDDSVYILPAVNNYLNYKNYVESLPLITIDKFELGIIPGRAISLAFKACPSLNNKNYLNYISRSFAGKKLETTVFGTTYYSGKFSVSNSEYELCVFFPILANSLISLIDSTNSLDYGLYILFNKKNRDSVVSFGALKKILNENAEPILLENSPYRLYFNSILDTSFILKNAILLQSAKRNFSPELNSYFKNIKYINKLSFKNRNKKYQLLEFSGSWCLPCKEALPSLKLFYSKNKQNLELITIDKEENIANAKAYLRQSKMEWKVAYENLHCNQELNCFSRIFNINEYPSFLLFDLKGDLLFKGSSVNSLKEIENLFLRN